MSFRPVDPHRQLERLLEAEMEARLPSLLFFWKPVPEEDGPGPWVLSQWWPTELEVDGTTYPHAEAYMMAEKARLFGDEDTCRRILESKDPAEARRLGRRVRGFYGPLWEERRFETVVRGNLAKVSQHDALGRYLVPTAPEVLVEASPNDTVWGIGLAAHDEGAGRPSEWRGLNLLGFALVAVRDRMAGAK
ncbi:MAG: NADAR family protein [Acidimicrobiia bacterium]